jgi:hypothetical protein
MIKLKWDDSFNPGDNPQALEALRRLGQDGGIRVTEPSGWIVLTIDGSIMFLLDNGKPSKIGTWQKDIQ